MSPAKTQAQLQSAVTHHLAGRWDEAARLYENLRIANPRDFQINHLLRSAPAAAGPARRGPRAAGEGPAQQPALGPDPDVPRARLGALGRREEAETTLRESLRLDPRSHEPG